MCVCVCVCVCVCQLLGPSGAIFVMFVVCRVLIMFVVFGMKISYNVFPNTTLNVKRELILLLTHLTLTPTPSFHVLTHHPTSIHHLLYLALLSLALLLAVLHMLHATLVVSPRLPANANPPLRNFTMHVWQNGDVTTHFKMLATQPTPTSPHHYG